MLTAAPVTLMVQITPLTHDRMHHENSGGVELLLMSEICVWFQDFSIGLKCQHISSLSHVLTGMQHKTPPFLNAHLLLSRVYTVRCIQTSGTQLVHELPAQDTFAYLGLYVTV